MTALISGLAPASILACTSALALAKLSLSSPQRPCGSAAVTAMPAIAVLSKRTFHSSGVKFDLSAMPVPPFFILGCDAWGVAGSIAGNSRV